MTDQRFSISHGGGGIRWNLATYLRTQTHSAPVIDSDVATSSLSHLYHFKGGSSVMTTEFCSMGEDGTYNSGWIF